MRGPRRIASALKRKVAAYEKQAQKRAREKEKEELKRQNAAEKEAMRLQLEAEYAELNDYFSKKAQACGKRAIFSIIIAAYNAEEYIQETIESILKQKAGNSHTQIIVVDDGSSDGTAEVVKGLADEYPTIVEYHYQENQGVSAARNYGLTFQDGLFVGFLDSDDKFAKATFYELMRFAREHEDVRIFAMRTAFFDAKTGAHPLNYICEEDAVIDLREDFDYYPLSATRSFFHYSALQGKRFRTDLRFTEDSYIVHEIMLENEPVFGAMQRPQYYYRKRDTGDSASDGSRRNPCWYTETVSKSHVSIMDYALEQTGEVPKYIQYAVMYDLYWRLRAGILEDLFDEDFVSEYYSTVKGVLARIDDDVMLAVRGFDITLRVYAYALKHGYDFETLLSTMSSTPEGLQLTEPGEGDAGEKRAVPMRNTEDWGRLALDIVKISKSGDFIDIDGRIPSARVDASSVSLRFSDGQRWFDPEIFPHPHSKMRVPFGDGRLHSQVSFKVRMPVSDDMAISAEISLNGGAAYAPALSFGKFARLNGSFRQSSFAFLDPEHFIAIDEDPSLFWLIGGENARSAFGKLEKKHEGELKERKKCKGILPLRRAAIKHMRENPDERIWVFTDRVTSAEDSGEVMYRYVLEHPIENVRPVFVIRDDVPDYERLSALGEVVAAGSDEHLKAVLCADKIISSSGDEWVINPFGENHRLVKDLLHFDYVFLQHGVIKESLADWLYKNKKNISLFVTSAPRERDSIVEGEYGYDPDQVILTGLPRWDNFVNAKQESKRVIYFMPTWRSYLSPHTHWNSENADETSSQVEWFAETDYFKVINSVLADERLLGLLEEYDYQLKFAPHPRVGEAYHLFSASERVELLKPESFAYSDAYKEMSMLITDYSSTAFNVAIMKKAIAYIQFDKEEFYEGHTGTKDYYDYERDGFGPIAMTKDELVDIIADRMRDGMEMDEMYVKRVDEFFFIPSDGASRASLVMDEVLKLDEGRSVPWQYCMKK